MYNSYTWYIPYMIHTCINAIIKYELYAFEIVIYHVFIIRSRAYLF